MRKVYRTLAYLVAIEVAIQAAAMAYAVAGLTKWVGSDGGVLNQQVIESGATPFPEVVGFMIHGINGMMVIPLLALLLLITSFFTKVKGAAKWAAAVLGLVVLQVALGILLHGIPGLGALHGLNALLLFAAALYTGYRAKKETETPAQVTRTGAEVPAPATTGRPVPTS